jgi:hypothetical protein
MPRPFGRLKIIEPNGRGLLATAIITRVSSPPGELPPAVDASGSEDVCRRHCQSVIVGVVDVFA